MRLIDADAVEKVLEEKHFRRVLDSDRWVIADIKKSIMELPTIDAEPVRHRLEKSDAGMTVSEYRERMMQAFHNADCDNLIAVVVLPTKKEFQHLEWLLKKEYVPFLEKAKRHGKWKWLSCTYDRVPKEKEYECSECHHKTIVHGDDMPWEKYCPNCGARMDEE